MDGSVDTMLTPTVWVIPCPYRSVYRRSVRLAETALPGDNVVILPAMQTVGAILRDGDVKDVVV